jgi:hypothetical protein
MATLSPSLSSVDCHKCISWDQKTESIAEAEPLSRSTVTRRAHFLRLLAVKIREILRAAVHHCTPRVSAEAHSFVCHQYRKHTRKK